MEQPSQSIKESEIYYLGAISRRNDLGSFQGKPFDLIVIQVYAPITDAKEADQFYEDLRPLELTPNKDVLFIIGDWSAKVESQEIPGITGKFGFGEQIEAGQRLAEFCQENAKWSYETSSFNNTSDNSTHGHHQMVHTKIRLIICFAAKNGEAPYSQQKQDLGLTVDQIMSSFL